MEIKKTHRHAFVGIVLGGDMIEIIVLLPLSVVLPFFVAARIQQTSAYCEAFGGHANTLTISCKVAVIELALQRSDCFHVHRQGLGSTPKRH
ncbi:hypothetical protein BDN70DRAFT_877028 [Pholiota conissans]|uniref:Uncharacterized protein n=1 Tax=Pholiota conissans TaxID=109636 RepID=A0A9P5Z4A1_9AGAR|nr:hypothetical protein BDN70DRAFT_877028 [Pholiota conissans]